MFAIPDRLERGAPWPLGASWDGLGTNFAVFSGSAESIELCIFDPSGRKELARLPLPDCIDEIWCGYLPEAPLGLVYGYRAHGPYEPERGLRFNPHKLLLDPYAKQLTGPLRWSDAVYGYRLQSQRADLSFDRRDSAGAVPKAMVVDDSFNWGGDVRPQVPWSETVIYEAHVRGVSMLREDIRPDLRGRIAALAEPRFIEHLKRLGVTAIELLPIHAFVRDRFLVEKGLTNYWGYNTLAYLAPDPAYLATGQLNELRVAVRRFHAAGIEVFLDVVYNHTCEGNELGPTLCFRGLDNPSYYRLLPDSPRHHINDTGCGNVLNLSHPRVLQLVMDSLRYWATSFRIDGFRFDLSSTLGREPGGFDPGSGFFDAARQDPVLSRLKLIAEPWDVGPGGYQLGNHPPGWAEWNDRYRDGVRRFWRGDGGMRGEIAARLSGSADFFDHRRRRAWASINFVTSHDGFTLHDVVSYAQKHNEANLENNQDGHNENFSANHGVEGETEDEAILATRRALQRAMLATLMLSQGTPMLLGGDELDRSQQGNNNAYCQDSPLGWLDFERARTPQARELIGLIARLSDLRLALPTLRSERFAHGTPTGVEDLDDIGWFQERGEGMSEAEWRDPEGRTLALRRAGALDDGTIEVVLLLLNAAPDDREFALPPPRLDWRMMLDTADARAGERAFHGERVTVAARSLVLLAAWMDPRA